jgi:thiosulfate dehydrogenase
MQPEEEKYLIKTVIRISRYTIYMAITAVSCLVIAIISFSSNGQSEANVVSQTTSAASSAALPVPALPSGATTDRIIPADTWKAPDSGTIPQGKAGEMIRYGSALIAHTADYLGPKGSVARLSNGMNCQNCHMDGGTRLFGNNYASFISSYPKMSGRSGKVDPASERIRECFERSMAGKAPDTSGKEVQSILAYMKWIGKDVKKGQKLFGSATEKLKFMDHAADPLIGKVVFFQKCQSCHGSNGEGQLSADKKSYTYPPLWGKHSYNDGAGMYRITNLAGFVKNNMPYGATYQNPQLNDEEAWNVAAFINSQPRLHKDQHLDWTKLDKKPIDFPFGPYADRFSEKQHKYGPFKPIKDAQQSNINKS